MAKESDATERLSLNSNWVEKTQFALIFFVLFCGFLVSTTVSRLMPWHWSTSEKQSIFATASEAAGMVSTFAFMG
jgi:hypothetical protein